MSEKQVGMPDGFRSAGDQCAGQWFFPNRQAKPPVVVMAHGFGAEMSAGLPKIAEGFVNLGFATFLFDYRSFGRSEGFPRQWVDPTRHIEDWRAALKHVRNDERIDSDRVVLWGVSFSGGHVLTLAAEKPKGVIGVIAQSPHVSSVATLGMLSLRTMLGGVIAGLRDYLGSLFGRPHYSKIVGRPDELAAMNSAESYDGFMSLLEDRDAFDNRFLSRGFITTSMYNPIGVVDKIDIPVFIITGEKDSITPARAATKAASKIKLAEIQLVECDHYGPHSPPHFDTFANAEARFLLRICPRSDETEMAFSGGLEQAA